MKPPYINIICLRAQCYLLLSFFLNADRLQILQNTFIETNITYWNDSVLLRTFLF